MRAHAITVIQVGKRVTVRVSFPNHLLELFCQFLATRVDKQASLASLVQKAIRLRLVSSASSESFFRWVRLEPHRITIFRRLGVRLERYCKTSFLWLGRGGGLSWRRRNRRLLRHRVGWRKGFRDSIELIPAAQEDVVGLGSLDRINLFP